VDWADVTIVIIAVAAGSLVKGVTGAGLPLIAVPVIATVVGPKEAIVVMAIPTLISNVMMVRAYRRPISGIRDLPALLVAGAVGTVVGVRLLERLDPDALSLTMACSILLYIAARIIGVDIRIPPRLSRYTSPPIGVLAGTLQGATGVSGPLIAFYLHAYGLPRHDYLFALSLTLQIFSVSQIASIWFAGLYTPERLALSALAIIPVVLTLPLGVLMARRLSRPAFDRLVMAVLAASAGKLILDSV
jgi:uncharacterized membrane protein YfcA